MMKTGEAIRAVRGAEHGGGRAEWAEQFGGLAGAQRVDFSEPPNHAEAFLSALIGVYLRPILLPRNRLTADGFARSYLLRKPCS